MRRWAELFRRVTRWTGVFVCMAVAVLWGLSLIQRIRMENNQFCIEAYRGGILVVTTSDYLLLSPAETRLLQGSGLRPWIKGFGFLSGGQRFSFRVVWIPLWIPFVFVALPTGLLFWPRRRIGSGQCRKCGYDLTGNEKRWLSLCFGD